MIPFLVVPDISCKKLDQLKSCASSLSRVLDITELRQGLNRSYIYSTVRILAVLLTKAYEKHMDYSSRVPKFQDILIHRLTDPAQLYSLKLQSEDIMKK